MLTTTSGDMNIPITRTLSCAINLLKCITAWHIDYYEKKCFVEAKLGNTTMSLSDVKDINKGTIINLDKNAFEPITIYVDGKEFAKGEVVVRSKNNNFSLRVTELL